MAVVEKVTSATRNHCRNNSRKMQHVTYNHWRRQLWGTGTRAPFDFQ